MEDLLYRECCDLLFQRDSFANAAGFDYKQEFVYDISEQNTFTFRSNLACPYNSLREEELHDQKYTVLRLRKNSVEIQQIYRNDKHKVCVYQRKTHLDSLLQTSFYPESLVGKEDCYDAVFPFPSEFSGDFEQNINNSAMDSLKTIEDKILIATQKLLERHINPLNLIKDKLTTLFDLFFLNLRKQILQSVLDQSERPSDRIENQILQTTARIDDFSWIDLLVIGDDFLEELLASQKFRYYLAKPYTGQSFRFLSKALFHSITVHFQTESRRSFETSKKQTTVLELIKPNSNPPLLVALDFIYSGFDPDPLMMIYESLMIESLTVRITPVINSHPYTSFLSTVCHLNPYVLGRVLISEERRSNSSYWSLEYMHQVIFSYCCYLDRYLIEFCKFRNILQTNRYSSVYESMHQVNDEIKQRNFLYLKGESCSFVLNKAFEPLRVFVRGMKFPLKSDIVRFSNSEKNTNVVRQDENYTKTTTDNTQTAFVDENLSQSRVNMRNLLNLLEEDFPLLKCIDVVFSLDELIEFIRYSKPIHYSNMGRIIIRISSFEDQSDFLHQKAMVMQKMRLYNSMDCFSNINQFCILVENQDDLRNSVKYHISDEMFHHVEQRYAKTTVLDNTQKMNISHSQSNRYHPYKYPQENLTRKLRHCNFSSRDFPSSTIVKEYSDLRMFSNAPHILDQQLNCTN